jgi:hypothetical protein
MRIGLPSPVWHARDEPLRSEGPLGAAIAASEEANEASPEVDPFLTKEGNVSRGPAQFEEASTETEPGAGRRAEKRRWEAGSHAAGHGRHHLPRP